MSNPLPVAGALRPANPFPGLRPYEAAETHLFFGRDAQVDELLRRLAQTRFLAVVGTSGCGKSSLVRAGLLPALVGGYMAEVGSHWRIAVLRPGSEPTSQLAHALARAFRTTEAEQVETTLRRSSLGLIDAVRLADLAPSEAVLVVVDQFEELFRFQQGTGADPAEPAAFVKLLLEASGQRALPIYVLITMRSDFLGDCAQFHALPEALNHGQYLVPQLTRDQRREAIECPAAIAGASAAPRLVQRVLNDVGDDPQALPVLQHALTRTFGFWLADGQEGPIDFAHYERAGGMQSALDQHADEVFAALPEAEKRMAERLFRALTERDVSGRERRRPARVGRLNAILAAASEDERAGLRSVIEKFSAEGNAFLTVSGAGHSADDAVVDITHESLIRCWSLLRVWVREEAQSAEWFKRVARSAQLQARKEEGYWRDPGLAFALAMRERGRWNAAWAEQYGGGFEEAVRFLEESRRSQDSERAAQLLREEQALQTAEHARRTRRLAVLAALGVCLFAGLAGVAWYGWQTTRKAYKEAARAQAAAEKALQEEEVQRRALQGSFDQQRSLVRELETVQKKGEDLERVVRLARRRDPSLPAAARAAERPTDAYQTADTLGLVERRRPFGPGFSIAGDAAGLGSACCLVTRDGRRYLLGLTLVLGTRHGGAVSQPGGNAPGSQPVARLVFAGKDPLRSAALAELLPGIGFEPRLVTTNRPFAGTAEVEPGQDVRLLGRGSGFVAGSVVTVTADEIATTDISTGGDAGAPVFTPDDRLVGVLWGSHTRSGQPMSIVIPIRRLLEEAGVQLDTSPAMAYGIPRAKAE